MRRKWLILKVPETRHMPHKPKAAGTNWVPLALAITLLVSHRRKGVYADVLSNSCGTVLSLLNSSP